ncbi:amidohydrolase family protein [Eudoraea chungangensis]|uniref:amidohydrolase family protein n=1 Tax=Eudoraea chungangensis TaxID=1481905 RepID=UPI0023EE16AF|nr:amidohydrolase family protein [Eudoraea chungangensis]
MKNNSKKSAVLLLKSITLEQAMSIATIGGAEVLGVGDKLRSITVGKFADMILLHQNLFNIEVTEIYATKLEASIVIAKEVFTNN